MNDTYLVILSYLRTLLVGGLDSSTPFSNIYSMNSEKKLIESMQKYMDICKNLSSKGIW